MKKNLLMSKVLELIQGFSWEIERGKAIFFDGLTSHFQLFRHFILGNNGNLGTFCNHYWAVP